VVELTYRLPPKRTASRYFATIRVSNPATPRQSWVFVVSNRSSRAATDLLLAATIAEPQISSKTVDLAANSGTN